MKKLILALAILLLPHSAFAAVAYVNCGGATACIKSSSSGTSLSWAVDSNGANFMVINVGSRLSCTATDITGFSATYNGVAMTFDVGTADTSVYDGSNCAHGRILHLANPSAGSNTLSMSWTGSANMAITVSMFSGAGSVGTIVQQITTGNFSASQTITASDMLMGALVIADQVSVFNGNNSNYHEVSDTNNIGAGSETNTGSGSVTVDGTASGIHIFWAIPILAGGGGGGGYVAPTKNIIYGAILKGYKKP